MDRDDQVFIQAPCPGQVTVKNPFVLMNFKLGSLVNLAISNIPYYSESVPFFSFVFKGNCVSLKYILMTCFPPAECSRIYPILVSPVPCSCFNLCGVKLDKPARAYLPSFKKVKE